MAYNLAGGDDRVEELGGWSPQVAQTMIEDAGRVRKAAGVFMCVCVCMFVECVCL
jgi:hypothetical protein